MKAAAWILNFGSGHVAAVGARQQVHLMYDPQVVDVPATPHHCSQVVFFGAHCVPVFDFARWLVDHHSAEDRHYLGLYAFTSGVDAATHYGALWMASPPKRIEVDDSMATALPENPAGRWQQVARSCFEEGGAPVPILDLRRLFSGDI